MATEKVSEHAQAIREAIARFCTVFGGKRGMHEAAEAIGLSPRVAKAALYGEHIAAPEDRAARAIAAEMRLIEIEAEKLARRKAELQRRRAALEGAHVAVALDRGGMLEAGGLAGAAG